jgi:GTPase
MMRQNVGRTENRRMSVDRGGPALIGVGVLVGGLIVGGILVAMDMVLIGILVAGAAIPGALVAWVTAGDRM